MRPRRDRPRRDRARGARRSTRRRVLREATVGLLVPLTLMLILVGIAGGSSPAVQVESGSMRHSDHGFVGTLDTSDVVFLRAVGARTDVVTWVEGNPENAVTVDGSDLVMAGTNSPFRSYGDWGDVIIYRRGGETPIIHRAMLWIEPDDACVGVAVPDLGISCAQDLVLHHVGPADVDVVIDLRSLAGRFAPGQTGGFLTKGDHNNGPPGLGLALVDQESIPGEHGLVRPVPVDGVVGRAYGEVVAGGAPRLALQQRLNPPWACPAGPGAERCLSLPNFLGCSGFFFILLGLLVLTYRARRRRRAEKGRRGRPGRERGGA